MWLQKEIILKSSNKGFHLITEEILYALPEIRAISVGLVNLLLKHTSASLSLNENSDPDVRTDMKKFFEKLVPENEPYFNHTSEGPDDIPAHIKTSILGNSITIPITKGKLHLGIWQGIYLCEHRKDGGNRNIVATIFGEN